MCAIGLDTPARARYPHPCLETAVNTEPELHEDEEHVMPCAEAMLAGTLALMTGHAQNACACATQRNAI